MSGHEMKVRSVSPEKWFSPILCVVRESDLTRTVVLLCQEVTQTEDHGI